MMLKNKEKILKISLLTVGVLLIVLFGIFIFKKTHTENDMDDKQPVSTEETDEVLEDVEFPHAAELDQASEITDDGEQILYLPKDEIYEFSITDANNILLNFEKKDDKWIYVDDPSMEINGDRIDKILNYLCDIRVVDIIELDDEADAKDYGLSQESPMCLLRMLEVMRFLYLLVIAVMRIVMCILR
jgi:Ca2+/Na+ antiporter